MTYSKSGAPFGSYGSDDYFDRHQYNELQKRFDSTANDPRARAAFKKEITSPYKKGPKSAERLDARIAAARKPAAKPAPKAPAARKARTPKKK